MYALLDINKTMIINKLQVIGETPDISGVSLFIAQ